MKKLRLVVFAILGGGIGFLCAKYRLLSPPGDLHLTLTQKLVLLALLPMAWLVAVGLHELGHALAGRLQGFRLHWLTVGPLMWRRQPTGRLRFEWNRNLNTAGGLALSVPPDDVRLRERFRMFVAGGPLASLVWGVVGVGLYALLPAAAQGTVPAMALAMIGGISFLLFIVTILPFQAGGFASDGMRIRNLSRSGPAQELEVAMLTATIRGMAGIRPRALNRSALEAALALPVEHPSKLHLSYYLYLHHLDAGDPVAAGQHLANYRQQLPHLPPALQASVWLEAAFFSAAYEHDASAARAYLAEAKPNAFTSADQLPRVEAALARLIGDAERAHAQAQTALRELPRNLDQGSARLYQEWLQDTMRWAEQASVARVESA
ncbi:M50 family metallopeptidase [Hymenobacter aerilatus]|uniref:M50 family metallopeptidase n=1 Tax=Hymenobacter aerilatus TaxID=2932251 RepID=A0A8T9T1K2_9BACT|nr:M50 family metallopeptidase [Hymenobacter aerilatus]UOR07054.1 M50 family metallopeptidase [Hymenobacter aerilatus]